jgi:hypothetical protein
MGFFKTRFRRNMTPVCSALIINIACLTPLYASTTDDLLQKIHDNTVIILEKIDQTPEFLRSWLEPDDSDESDNLQKTFTTLNQFVQDVADGQTTNADNLDQVLFRTDPNGIAANDKNLFYGNDLTYPTLLNKPLFSPDPRNKPNQPEVDSALNYIKNASGMNIPHTLPAISGWQGTKTDQLAYYNYFSSVMAAQTYGGYVMSGHYADMKNPSGPFSKLQKQLMQQAGDGSWFASIGAADLGVVLRQLLLFQSQSFLVLTQLLVTEKQLLYAQVMNNTLTILNNQFNEKQILLKNARTKTVTSND